MRTLLKRVGRWFVEGWAEICQIFGGNGAPEAPPDMTQAAVGAAQLLTYVTSSGLLGPRENVELRVSLAHGLAQQASQEDKQALEALMQVGRLADRM